MSDALSILNDAYGSAAPSEVATSGASSETGNGIGESAYHDDVYRILDALVATEGSGSNATSAKGAYGKYQITPPTFKQFAKPGERPDNENDARNVALRKISSDYGRAQSMSDDKEKQLGITFASYQGGPGGGSLWSKGQGGTRNDGILNINQYVTRAFSKYNKLTGKPATESPALANQSTEVADDIPEEYQWLKAGTRIPDFNPLNSPDYKPNTPQVDDGKGIVGDTIKTVAAGAVSGVQTLADLGYAFSGWSPFDAASKGLNKVADSINSSMSHGMQEAKDKTFFGGEKGDEAWTDWRSYYYNVFNGVGSMIPMLPLGGVAGAGTRAVMGVGKVATEVASKAATATALRVTEEAIAKGASKEAAAKLGLEAGRGAMASTLKAHGLADTIGYTAAGTAMTAGDAANGAMDEIEGKTHDALMKSPAYAEALKQALANGLTGDAAKSSAKEDIKRAAGREASAIAGTFALPLNAVGGYVLGKLFHPGDMGAATRLGNVGRAAGMEVPTESAEEGLTQYASNQGVKDYADPNKDVTKGVADMAFKGGIGAVGMSAPHALRAPKPNSPLSTAADVGSASGPAIVPTTPGTPPAGPADIGGGSSNAPTSGAPGWGGYAQMSPFGDPKLDAMQQQIGAYLGDWNNEKKLKDVGGNDMLDQARYIWSQIINNPELPMKMRVSALQQAHDSLLNVPDFTMSQPAGAQRKPGQSQLTATGEQAALPNPNIDPSIIEGESRRVQGPTLEGKNEDGTPWYEKNPEARTMAQAQKDGALVSATPSAPAVAPAAAVSAAGVEQFPIANVRRPNGAIGTQGVTEAQIGDVLRHVAGMSIPDGALMREMVDAFKGDKAAQERLRQSTQANPIKVDYLPDGTYHLQDGHHRTFLLNQIGDTTVPAIVSGKPAAPAQKMPQATTTPVVEKPSTPTNTLEAIQQINQQNVTRRHDGIRQIVGQGFTTIATENGKHTLSNPKTGQSIVLHTPADVQIARAAIRKQIDDAAHTAASSPNNDTPVPTPGQIESENYKKGHLTLHGLNIAIENPNGSTRSGVDQDGKAWESTLNHHYGYIKKTEGADGDAVDVFVGPRPDSDRVFVVDQVNPKTGQFDEHKVMLGFTHEQDAKAGYAANYDAGWQGLGHITPMSMDEFKAWLKEGDTTKPVHQELATEETPTAVTTEENSGEENLNPPDVRFLLKRGEATAVRDFKDIPVSEFPNDQFFIRKEGNEYLITHRRTGLVITRGDSERLAIKNLGDLIAQKGVGFMQGVMDGRESISDDMKREALKNLEPTEVAETPTETSPETPAPGETTAGPTAEPKTPKEPRTPREKKVRPEDYVSMVAAKRWFEGNATDNEKAALGQNPQWKMLDGVPHVFNEGFETVMHVKKSDQIYSEEGFSSPRAEKQATGNVTGGETADPIQQLLDSSDVLGLAEAIFDEGKVPTEPAHMPMILPGNLIRVDIKAEDQKGIEATLKKLGFKVSDRMVKAAEDTPENAEAGRMTISAIYKPDISIHDAGEKMLGGRKEPPKVAPKDTDPATVQADEIIDGLAKADLTDPTRGGKEQTFGALMFLEALMQARTKPAADYIMSSAQLRRVRLNFKGERKQVAESIRQGYRDTVIERANRYRALMLEMQAIADKAGPTVQEIHTAFTAGLEASQEFTDGIQFLFNGHPEFRTLLDELYNKFSPDEHSTDQSEREIKIDPKIPPRLENIVRRGLPDWRKGRNISVQAELTQRADGSWIETGDGEFTRTFGLRGVEFGNWVNQGERQVNVNMAFDALMDMAHLLHIPPATLGMAMNGQNLGLAIGARGRGGKAAAHYEPDNHVINLTKTMGNGTVSHEWAHAFEWALRSTTAGKLLSTELRLALKSKWNPAMLEELVRAKLSGESSMQSDRNVPPKQAALAMLLDPGFINRETARVTDYFNDAEAMDRGANEKYWSTDHELFARAHEAMFFDAAKGGSPYLTGPTVADGYQTKKNGYKGTPYPRGAERESISYAIQHAMEQIDFNSFQVKSYEIEPEIRKMLDGSYIVFDQMGVPLEQWGRYVSKTEDQANTVADHKRGNIAVFGPLSKMKAEIAKNADEIASRIDKIMEEMGIRDFPEIKNGSMAESMFYHLRNGWWPSSNNDLKDFAAKAFGIDKLELDRLKQYQAQEDFEAALGKYTAQLIVDWRRQGAGEEGVYRNLVELYNKQPRLDNATTTSKNNQAFSTPTPIGFLAGLLARIKSTTKVLEPTAGNGLLAVGANPQRVIAVELDAHRALNLKLMDFDVRQGNALTAFDEGGLVQKQEPDVLITNPPFGMAPAEKRYDGYRVKGLDQQIAANALALLPDDGRAVLVLGANMQPGAITEKDRTFLNWLYGHYNVADHFEIAGPMYARQGASWPIRVIVIAGRYNSDRLGPTAGMIDRVSDWDQLWSRANEALQRSEQVLVGSGERPALDGSADQDTTGVLGGNSGENSGNSGEDAEGGTGVSGTDHSGSGERPGEAGAGGLGGSEPTGVDPSGRPGNGGSGGGRGGSTGGGRRSGGASSGGLSGLEKITTADIDNLLGNLAGGGNIVVIDNDVRKQGGWVDGDGNPVPPPRGGGGGRRGKRTKSGDGNSVAGVDLSAESAEIARILNDPKFSKGSYVRGEGVNKAKYEALFGIMERAWNRIVETVKDASKVVVEFGQWMISKHGNGIIPYVRAFINEHILGYIDASQRKQRMALEDKDNTLQTVFVGPSSGDWAGIYTPKSLWDKSMTALGKLTDKYVEQYPEGIDQMVTAELGYSSPKEMLQFLAGYQSATVALAVDQVKDGNGFIIGHDTGVGKGRVVAAMMVWAKRNGKIPVFMTVKKDLYTDIYRDLSDISHSDMHLKMTDSSKAFINDSHGDVKWKANPADAKATLDSLINEGALLGDALVTSYSQFDGPSGSRRRDALRGLVRTGKVMLLLDESHNAAGQSARNEFFMELLTGNGLFKDDSGKTIAPPSDWVPPATIYSSATFSKFSNNLPVYARTDLRYPADNNPANLRDIFMNNNQLTQVAAEMLVESGQMLRFERSYDGIDPHWEIDSENTARDARVADKATEIMRALVLADRAFGTLVSDDNFIALIRPLLPVGVIPAVSSKGIMETAHHPFTSVVHNLVKQMLFATKIEFTVKSIIDSLNKDEKPVVAMESTMGAALEKYAESAGIATGASLKGFGWNTVFERNIDNARTVTFKLANGDPFKFVVPWNILSEHAGHVFAEFERVRGMVDNSKIDLSVSPIDSIRIKLNDYAVYKDSEGKTHAVLWADVPDGVNAKSIISSEVTGRKRIIDFSDKENPILANRNDDNAVEAINKFNRGSVDVVLLNVSGSTGISLHASEKFDDQRVRRMLIVQPLADIATFKQMLGRINRTGQVELPLYDVLSTGIPAEKRLLAVLRKKFKSLMSGTTAGDNAATDINVTDFINEVGDKSVADYLRENTAIRMFVEKDPGMGDDDVPADFALEVTGRVALLSVEQQTKFYEDVEANFNGRIAALIALNENPLTRAYMPFDAEATSKDILAEGGDSSRPFLADAWMGHYEVSDVGESPSPQRVREAIASALAIPVDQVGTQDARLRARATVDFIEGDLKLAYEEHQSQLTGEILAIEEALRAGNLTIKQTEQLQGSLRVQQSAQNDIAQRKSTTLHSLKSTFAIGTGMKLKIDDEEINAIVTGHRVGKTHGISGNPYKASNFGINFSVAMPSGAMSFALSQIESRKSLVVDGSSNSRPAIDSMFVARSVGQRTMRHIATGNLPLAIATLNDQQTGGTLITFSEKGEEKPVTGYLMPKTYKPGNLATADYVVRSPEGARDYLLAVVHGILEKEGYDERAAEALALLNGAPTLTPEQLKEAMIERVKQHDGSFSEYRSTTQLFSKARVLKFDVNPHRGDLSLIVKLPEGRSTWFKNKELAKILGDFAAKKGDQFSSKNVPLDKLGEVLRIVRFSTGLSITRNREDIVKQYIAHNVSKASKASWNSESKPVSTANDVQSVVDSVTGKWMDGPGISVYATEAEAQAKTGEGIGSGTEGWYKNGQIHLIAENLHGKAHIEQVLIHEAIGHYGVEKVLGESFDGFLKRLAVMEKANPAIAELGRLVDERQPGLSADRRGAEIIAIMAERGMHNSLISKIKSAIRNFIRNVLGIDLEMTDTDVADIIRQAVGSVSGDPGPKGGLIPSIGEQYHKGAVRGLQIANAEPVMSKSSAEPKLSVNSYIDIDLLREQIREKLGDAFSSKRTFNSWWHRTVGTQYHKAEIDPEHFGPVFNMAQRFIDDIARYANTAADLAPNLLPKLEKLSEAVSGMMNISRDSKNAKAIADPIFQGTLNDKVYTDSELETQFNLNADQITLYHEFRAAVNQSLDSLAISEMNRLAKMEKLKLSEEGLSLEETAQYYRDQFEGELEKAQDAVTDLRDRQRIERDMLNKIAEEDAANGKESRHYADLMVKMQNRQRSELEEANLAVSNFQQLQIGITDKLVKIEKLKENGYAPLMRFGDYTVDIFLEGEDKDGNKTGKPALDASGEEIRHFFGMFESEAEANKAARILQEEYPNATVKQGVLSNEAASLFKGVTPETVELFAQLAGAEQSDAFQKYLKMAVNNRSAMKRLIHRKMTAGFVEDPSRVLASFITSNARASAQNDYFGDMLRAASAIPKEKGDVKDEAIKLLSYLQNPQEEASKIRGLLFVNFLGGSVAAAMTNMTQPLLMTYPYLHQFSKNAGSTLTWAMKIASKKLVGKDIQIDDPALMTALKRAGEEGITSPHEIHMLYGESGRTGMFQNNRFVRNATNVWGSFFSLSEGFNRYATFMAAFKIAEENNMDGDAAYEFAKKAVYDTQGVYCVDTETEILTAQGWRFYNQLERGQGVFTIDKSGAVVEDSLLNVHVFPGHYEMTEFRNKNGLSIVVSDNHRNIVQNYSSRDKKWQGIRAVETKDLKGCNFFLRTPLSNGIERHAIYSDDQVRLMAWVAAEGYFFSHRNVKVKRGVGLVQSQTHNPEYVAEIDDLLERLGGHCNRKQAIKSRGDTMICWQLRKPLWSFIGEALPEKRVSMDLLSRLTVPQMSIFLETFARGDGTFLDEGGYAIGQKSIETLNTLQAMAVLTGNSSTMWERQKDTANNCLRDYGTVYVAKNSKRAYVKEFEKTRVVVDTVWCPETTSGTWIARRNGRTFITGNSKANRPNWARGAIGATLFTFKQFSIAYIEFLKRLPAKERALALACLMLAAGAQGMPGADDLDDLIDTIAESLGFNFGSKQAKRDFVAKLLGKEASGYVLYGISHGLPLDVAGRMSAGNLLPGTGIFKKSEIDKTRDVKEFFGAAGGLADNAMRSIGKAQEADAAGTLKAIMPKAMQDVYKSYDMIHTGEYHDTKGRLVAKATPLDAFIKLIGFQPTHLAEDSRTRTMLMQESSLLKATQGAIYERWAQGIAEGDGTKTATARAELSKWNSNNPDSIIIPKMSDIQRRVKQIKQTADDRFIKATPKQLRKDAAAELNSSGE